MEKLTNERLFSTCEEMRILSRRGDRRREDECRFREKNLERSSTRMFVGKRIRRGWSVKGGLGTRDDVFQPSQSRRRTPSSCSRRIIANTRRISFLGTVDSVGGVVRFRTNFSWIDRCRLIRELGLWRHWPLMCCHLAKRAWRGDLRAAFLQFERNICNRLFNSSRLERNTKTLECCE